MRVGCLVLLLALGGGAYWALRAGLYERLVRASYAKHGVSPEAPLGEWAKVRATLVDEIELAPAPYRIVDPLPKKLLLPDEKAVELVKPGTEEFEAPLAIFFVLGPGDEIRAVAAQFPYMAQPGLAAYRDPLSRWVANYWLEVGLPEPVFRQIHPDPNLPKFVRKEAYHEAGRIEGAWWKQRDSYEWVRLKRS